MRCTEWFETLNGSFREMSSDMSQSDSKPSGMVRGVTSRNTTAHWILYAIDAIEAENPEQTREQGLKADDVWAYASDENDESIVFRGDPEIRWQMKQLATERNALARRTDETDWADDDVDWYYRLNEKGRKALLDLGVPEYLPNRRDPEHDRELPMSPSHSPGWWLEESDQPDFDVEAGWSLNDNDWVEGGTEGVYFKDEADRGMALQRGYDRIAQDLKEAFPEVTFVVTCGPYRTHDLMYRIRDPFEKVVQIDVYSPMAVSRTTEEITDVIQQLVVDLHHALETVDEEIDNE